MKLIENPQVKNFAEIYLEEMPVSILEMPIPILENTSFEPYIPTLKDEIINMIIQLYRQKGIITFFERIEINRNRSMIKVILSFEDTHYNRMHIPTHNEVYQWGQDYCRQNNITYPIETVFVLENISNKHSVFKADIYRSPSYIDGGNFKINKRKLRQIDKILDIVQNKIEIEHISVYPRRKQYNSVELYCSQHPEKNENGEYIIFRHILITLSEAGEFYIDKNEVKRLNNWDNTNKYHTGTEIEIKLYDSIDMFLVQEYILEKLKLCERQDVDIFICYYYKNNRDKNN